ALVKDAIFQHAIEIVTIPFLSTLNRAKDCLKSRVVLLPLVLVSAIFSSLLASMFTQWPTIVIQDVYLIILFNFSTISMAC
ncbi:hypothetical protein, partial [Vibrio parahaemolyticus]|uniref:hypothetical protein n=1 Tax=Vibrio parahaemolyticus TaxID=670 RepID=UPI001C5F1453